MAELTLTSARKSFGNIDVLHGIDLAVKDGEFVVFVGPSGCGKSTLLRVIAGLENVTSGEVHIDGERVTHLPASDRGLAMVFQSYALYPHMSVRKNMAFALENMGLKPADIEARGTAPPPCCVSPTISTATQGALRRPAPARRHRAGHRARSQDFSVRRAAVEPRRRTARRDAQGIGALMPNSAAP
jgi:ABC-type sugar transport systems, ATPase components